MDSNSSSEGEETPKKQNIKFAKKSILHQEVISEQNSQNDGNSDGSYISNYKVNEKYKNVLNENVDNFVQEEEGIIIYLKN